MRTAPIVCVLALVVLTVGTIRADSRDWSLTDTRGESFKLSSALGESPILLVFWATWCVPCKRELRDHKSFFGSLTEKGVQVILVSEDTPRTDDKVKPYLESKGYRWRALLDQDGAVLKRYGGTSLPYTVLLDKDGNAVRKIRGAFKNTQTLTNDIQQLQSKTGE